jgi:hypothetical protein
VTASGTNLLGLVKHLSVWEARYFAEVFGRAFPEPLPRWDDARSRGTDLWAGEEETRQEITDRYRRVCSHSDATITELDIDSPGHVPWWARPNVMLFNILVHTPPARYRAEPSDTSGNAASRVVGGAAEDASAFALVVCAATF